MAERAPLTLAVAFPSTRPKPLTGAVEMRIADALSAGISRPEKVSAILAALFERIGGAPGTMALARRLATGSRSWLLLKAAGMFQAGQDWFSASCGECGESYDLRLNPAEVPRSAPGAGYPFVTVETSLGPRRFEAPNGLAEEALASGRQDPARLLAATCGLAKEADRDAAEFTKADLAMILSALDEITPDIAETVTSTCPSCGAETAARLDPLDYAFPTAARLDREIHLIAGHYGWDEPTILALPSHRRQRHAAMIREAGSRRRA